LDVRGKAKARTKAKTEAKPEGDNNALLDGDEDAGVREVRTPEENTIAAEAAVYEVDD
jgi:hypothetical protein